jgi:lipoteichoic acid synthase
MEAKLAGRLRASARPFVAVSLALLPLLLLLRVYGYVVVRTAGMLPTGAGRASLFGVWTDVGFMLQVAAVLAIPVLALSLAWPLAAIRAHRVAIVVVVMLQVALAQYFAVTRVPLGADLFGYSTSDIRSTVMTSKGVSVTAALAFVAFAAIAWVVTGYARRLRVPDGATALYLVCAVLSTAVPGVLTPRASSYVGDAQYFMATNPAQYFASRTLRHFGSRLVGGGAGGAEPTGYPLLRVAHRDDVLGPFMNTASAPPNLVLVIVEGLGRDFVGEGALYGGFTPYLDSLTRRSLWWDNFVSTSGRTFGILPALLGSLPHADGGFMELGPRMPHHASLASLLHERGYTTSYFSGTNGHFDMIDAFMEKQGVDSFIDASRFGPGYEMQPAERGGTSWGYGDQELFRRALASMGTNAAHPRLDIFLTITTHEPFIPPREADYAARFEQRLAALRPSANRAAELRSYRGELETLLYLDDGIRAFIEGYAKRPDFARTIFMITGDHRLIPIPPATRMDRYRVPFIMWSPLMKAPERFSSVSSHLDVTPSLLALLEGRYGMHFPDTVAWLGTGLDTARAFRDQRSLDLMRTKADDDEYLDGRWFLSGERIFSVGDRLDISEVRNDSVRDRLTGELARAQRVGAYVTTRDRVLPGSAKDSASQRLAAHDDSVIATYNLGTNQPEALFKIARERALAGNYESARTIARKLLRDSPNYHDARALLGRTYAWQRRFDEARAILRELVERAPEYSDGWVALADVEVWSANGEAALARADDGLKRFPGNAELLAIRARALNLIATARKSLQRP